MRLNFTSGMVALGVALACSSPSAKPTGSTTPASGPTVTPAAPVDVAQAPRPAPPPSKPASGPVAERAAVLREAADQLEKAGAALARNQKSLAEQLFSTAELLVGPEALAQLAPMFREGAPPRVTTPTIKVDTKSPPQPRFAGNSEADDEAAKVPPPRAVGNLTGTMQIDNKSGGSYGLVTLEPANGRWKPRKPKAHVIEQRGREFLPNLVAISVGSTVAFPNFDAVFHNVFSNSTPAKFDLGLYKAGEAREYKFEKEGIVRLGCNLHANMSAFIAVVAAPSYVVTDADGSFTFRRLAPGKYKLKAWSVKSKAPITQDITIKAGRNEVTVGVQGDAPPGPMPDKFGGKRG